MAMYKENYCCSCPQGCIGSGCEYYDDVIIYVCDICGKEFQYQGSLKEYQGQDICDNCMDELDELLEEETA